MDCDIRKVLGVENGINPRSEYQDIISFLKFGPKRIDLPVLLPAIFRNGRIVFFGEEHDNVPPKDKMIKHMGEYASMGVTHLAMEMLKESMQPAIDGYYAAENSGAELLTYLRERWNFGPGIPEKYMEMVDAAKSCGIKVVGLDIELAGDEHRLCAGGLEAQNGSWSGVIYRTLHSKGCDKLMVYCGAAHIDYCGRSNSTNQKLTKVGVSSTVVKYMCGNNFIPSLASCVSFENYLERAISDCGLESQDFAIAVNPIIPRHADLYFHLP